MDLRPMVWDDGVLRMLDQRVLPRTETWLELRTWEEVAAAVRDMAVRGAPAIGVAAGYGMALAALAGADRATARAGLAASRPTAVNLFWALDQTDQAPWDPSAVLEVARRIEADDLAMNQAIGRHGAALVPEGARVLTVCNTGSLATAGHGTALGVVRTAYAQGKVRHVFACETRPRQQGLRLTAWELMHDGIPFQVIPDGAAAYLMSKGEVDFVVVGADRIAANGDTANKIGTYTLAVLARHFGVPFTVAAPTSTLDPSTPTGAGIPIEERDASEVTHVDGVPVGPDRCPVWNPAFDVTPGDLVTAIITESGVHQGPYRFMGPSQ
ncbi:MAG: S-methyl-5-thioribose-1-phosphate isomerase [Fimbriimonadaceae bacterium]|nr:S-methyl-5-thioribose-1-phosphate isomerase [Fimbriimonadaceae bacterium]